LKVVPTAPCGGFPPASTAVVSQALRRAWSRIAEIAAGERRMLGDAVGFSVDVGGLAERQGARPDDPHESSHRVFRAPGLVYDPPASGQPLRRRRPAAAPLDAAFGMGRGARSSDRFSR
jgi:hypothetical protein